MTRTDRDDREPHDDSDDATLRVTTETGEGWTVVAVDGEIDVASAPTFEEVLQSAMAASDRVVIDLSGVQFMDSTGLGVLMRAHKRQDDAGAILRLAAPSDRVVRILDITQLDAVFAVYPSVDASQAAPLGEPTE